MNTSLSLIMSAVAAVGLLGYMYADSLEFLLRLWWGSEDYGFGLFIPFVSLVLIWRLRHRIAEVRVEKSVWGVVIITAGLLLYWVGELTTVFFILHVSLWMVIVGLTVSLIGIPRTRVIAFPLGYLLAAIPLPTFIYAGLASQLQLWSSALGVGFLQLVGVLAFREGNVIDLGSVQLQVIEACSGIRYLFPLTALALLCAYLYQDKTWKRVVLVVSAIPISILINGFRIGVIGILVELYGQGAAEGFYHLFEGWVLFMSSLGVLLLEMLILSKIPSKGVSARRVLSSANLAMSDRGARTDIPVRSSAVLRPSFPGPVYLYSVALLVPFAMASAAIDQREERPPARAQFVDFPMVLQGWKGTSLHLEKQFIDLLRFDDYVLADYRASGGSPVNFYSAYYRSQKKGQSAHSPQSCLPGGGWEISSFERVTVPSSVRSSSAIVANRVLIQKEDQRQVVLYWFKQRNRALASEYLVKFYLLWDAMTMDRTDGALVRIASLIGSGETEASADRRVMEFAMAIEPELRRFVPD
ncbi:conserved membrane protein of unknown function [Nitrospira japonica]|uniref:Methanolan biosynthesis EpsI domain-containing protein n=2 Tax=Nitrospira japonica TaxID=1325564 RepID=A0A1W1I9F2_9BACT|nr:conserved membrane protein of unknown function [Nitrospira japonica]